MMGNMGRLIFVISAAVGLFGTLSGCAGPQLKPEERLVERVYDAKGYSKDKLYQGARTWMAENFRSAKAVIDYENKEEATIIGNGTMAYPCKGMDCLGKSDWRVSFTMRFEAKEERFRLDFTNLKISWPASYNSGFRSPAYEGGVNLQNEMNDIKPVLLGFGDGITRSLNKASTKSNW